MKQQLQQLRQQQKNYQQDAQRFARQAAPPEGSPEGSPEGGGVGGEDWGVGDGGNPYGQHSTYEHDSHAESDIHDDQGRTINNWIKDGQAGSDEAQGEYNRALTDARAAAERAVTEDRVPRRHQEAIKRYFDQLPENLKTQAQEPSQGEGE